MHTRRWADGPVLHGQPQPRSFCVKKTGHRLTLTSAQLVSGFYFFCFFVFFAGAVLAGI